MLQELNLQEMNEVMGGITVEEYCATVWFLIDHNWDSWNYNEQISAINALNAHCPN